MQNLYHLTDREVALYVASRMREWRVSPRGAAMTQEELSRKSGVGTTPIKRFEKTGGATLGSFIAMLRAMNLLERLQEVVPTPQTPGPIEILNASRSQPPRKRAPRTSKHG